MESLKGALALFPGDLHRAIIFVLIARMSCADWVVGNRIARPDTPTGFSVNSVSASLSRPFETVRRHIRAMIRAGICAKSDNGIILSPSCDRESEVVLYYRSQAELLAGMIKSLATSKVPLPLKGAPDDQPLRLLVTSALDIGLIALENHKHGNWFELIIHGALIHENGRNVMNSPELTRDYGNQIIPDSLRVPVKIRRISEDYGIPYATVRRHLMMMHKGGLLEKSAGGYILKTQWTAQPERLENSDRTVNYLLRQLKSLAAADV